MGQFVYGSGILMSILRYRQSRGVSTRVPSGGKQSTKGGSTVVTSLTVADSANFAEHVVSASHSLCAPFFTRYTW